MTDAINVSGSPIPSDADLRRAALAEAITVAIAERRRAAADLGQAVRFAGGDMDVGRVAQSDSRRQGGGPVSVGPRADRIITLLCWTGWAAVGVGLFRLAWHTVLG